MKLKIDTYGQYFWRTLSYNQQKKWYDNNPQYFNQNFLIKYIHIFKNLVKFSNKKSQIDSAWVMAYASILNK